MAYTRWSNSDWYSFWRSDSDPSKEGQVLALWYSLDLCKDWTYSQLKDMSIEDITIEYAGVPHDQIVEAMDIIKRFIDDVDFEFQK